MCVPHFSHPTVINPPGARRLAAPLAHDFVQLRLTDVASHIPVDGARFKRMPRIDSAYRDRIGLFVGRTSASGFEATQPMKS